MSVRRRRASIVVATALLGLLAGCTVGPSSRPELAVYGDSGPAPAETDTTVPVGPGGPGQPGEFDPTWHSCDDLDTPDPAAATFTSSCATVLVPLDHTNPDGDEQVQLSVGRATAPGLAADAPPLVVVMGNGPLDASLTGVNGLANLAASLPADITATFQIIGLDVRGSGGSSATDCFRDYPQEYLYTLDADLAATEAKAQLVDVTRAFTFGCQDYVGPEMVYFGTTQAADDLDSIRTALGVETLNYLGAGYGATLGAVYANRYPGRIGRVVLDSPTDSASSSADRALTSAQQYERALQAFFAACAATAPCALGSDPAATVQAASGALSYDPNNNSDDWYLGSSSPLWALIAALPNHELWPQLGTAIAAAAGRDSGPLVDLLDELLAGSSGSLSDRLMIQCNDSDERVADNDLATRLTAAKDAAPTFGSFLVGLSSLCRQWPAPETPLGSLRAQGAAPLLVTGGVNDPVAPYVGVQAVANQLASATLISYQGTDHGGYPRSACVAAAVNAYLLDGTMPAGGTLCPA